MCGEKSESLDHVFWTCNKVRITWAVFLQWFDMEEELSRPDFNSFLVVAMQSHFSPQLAALWKIGIVSLVWTIWTARNGAIFECRVWCSYKILSMVKAMLMEANGSRHLGYMFNTVGDLLKLRSIGVSGNPAPPKKLIQGTWWPPPVGWIKVSTDGSAVGCPGIARAGGVFRDACDQVLACFQVSGGVAFAFEAELLGAITAMEIAWAKGWHHLWLESNSSYVVGLLGSRDWRIPL